MENPRPGRKDITPNDRSTDMGDSVTSTDMGPIEGEGQEPSTSPQAKPQTGPNVDTDMGGE